ncbi:hypothetical protein [Rhodococcus wratislaviensis]|uniref:hypothetical protein n=1 Tax=Rhodococcus wratislaviensis TaxID=44752 RepID=UPI00351941D8
MSWAQEWSPIPGQHVFDKDNQQIAAVARGPGNLDLFVIGLDNHIWSAAWNQASGWSPEWFPIPGQHVFDHKHQQVTAVARGPGMLDLFVIGLDNHIWSAAWKDGIGWTQEWFPIPGQHVFDHERQRIAAVARGLGMLDLFVIGLDNHIWSAAWKDGIGWTQEWFPIPGQHVFDKDNQQIAAVARGPGNLDLFVIGLDNHIWSAAWNQASGWSPEWFPIPGQHVFDHERQQVAAVARGPGMLDLFVIGLDNHIWSAAWKDGIGWTQEWFPIPGQHVFDHERQQIAAVARRTGNLDLFVIGLDNHIWSAAWNQASSVWTSEWFPIPGQHVFDHERQQIAAVARGPVNLDLFVIGLDNHVWTSRWMSGTTSDLVGGYQLTEGDSALVIAHPDGMQSHVQVLADRLTPQQRDQVLEKMKEDILKYFSENKEKIISGNIKAADIGGAVYGIGWLAVLAIVQPLAVVEGLIRAISGVGPGNLAVNTGEYYGKIVDAAIGILKGESQHTISTAIGTMGALYFTCVSPLAGAVRFFGGDGWSFTEKVGKEIGGALEDTIDAIGSVPGDVGDFIEDLFDDIF